MAASLLPALWTAVAAVGLLLFGLIVQETIQDQRWLKRQPDFIRRGPRDLVARAAIRTAIGHAIIEGVFVFIGVLALLNTSSHGYAPLVTALLPLLFIATAALLAWLGWVARRERQELFATLPAPPAPAVTAQLARLADIGEDTNRVAHQVADAVVPRKEGGGT